MHACMGSVFHVFFYDYVFFFCFFLVFRFLLGVGRKSYSLSLSLFFYKIGPSNTLRAHKLEQ